ncbi:TPA: hypothetical protein MX526_004991 [Enterobacter hormaechei]|nr:hypothetical protein [Enterobacter hormaechei]
MSNIDKQALRSTSERDWFEDWFKREFHPDKTGPYIKDQLFFAVRAARAPLLDELEAAEKRIAELEAKLDSADKLQDSAFRHGLQHGFSFGQTDNQAGFEECLSAYGARGKDNG